MRSLASSLLWSAVFGTTVLVASAGLLGEERSRPRATQDDKSDDSLFGHLEHRIANRSELPPAPAAPTAAAAKPTLAPVDKTSMATAKELRFGLVAPLSGPSKELGEQMKVGITTAFAEVNEKGGIFGRKLTLKVADDGYEPNRTVAAMQQLHDDDQVVGFIGDVGTPTTTAALPYALQKQILLFGCFTGAKVLRTVPPDRYVFNVRASYEEETSAIVGYLAKLKGLTAANIAVFTQDDSFGDDGFAGVEKALRSLNNGWSRPVLRIRYKRNTIDVADAVAQLTRHKAIKAVVMVAAYRAAAAFIEKTRDLRPNLIYTNVSFVGSNQLIDELTLLDPRYAKDIIITQVVPPVDGHSTPVLNYKSALHKYAAAEIPNYVSLEAYDDGKILIEGLKRAGADPSIEKLVLALEGLHGADLDLGFAVNFGSLDHQASHIIWGTKADSDGKLKSLELN